MDLPTGMLSHCVECFPFGFGLDEEQKRNLLSFFTNESTSDKFEKAGIISFEKLLMPLVENDSFRTSLSSTDWACGSCRR